MIFGCPLSVLSEFAHVQQHDPVWVLRNEMPISSLPLTTTHSVMMRRILHSSSLSFILMSRVRALLTISSQDASSYPSQDSSNTAPDKTAEIISGPRSRNLGLVLRVLCSLYVNLFVLLVAPLASRLGGSTRAADCLQVRRRCAYADVSVRPSVLPYAALTFSLIAATAAEK